jgi:adenine-specific DNA methylase
MDILTYDYLLNGLKEYNKEIDQNYGNVVVPFPTTNTTYPTTVFEEIRNVANQNYNSCYERLASVGYRADIYAKTKGSVSKQIIARKIAQEVDEYLTNVGLTRVSFNVSELENDSSIYHIIMTYSGNLHENRRRFI